MAFDIYAAVTDRIISELEKGVIPWRKPWTGSRYAIKRSTGKPYSLLNQMILGKPGEYLIFNKPHRRSQNNPRRFARVPGERLADRFPQKIT